MNHSMTPPRPKPRRLLLLTPFFPSHGGGVEKIGEELSRHMLRGDETLHIEWFSASGDALPAPTPRLRMATLRVWNGIEKRLGVPIPLPSPHALGRLWRAIARCDAGHLHDFAYPAHLAAALFFTLQKKPYFITQHIGEVPYQNPLLRHLLDFINATSGRWVLSRAAKVVFYSEKVRRKFAVCDAAFIANGVDATTFSPSGMGRKGGAPRILFVGRFVEKKGVPLLVELSRRMADVEWIFVGRGPLDPAGKVGRNVQIMRGLGSAQIAALCRAADLLILPSRGEGFPLVIQESLACGTPVLAETALGEAAPAAREWMNLESLGRPDDAARWEKRARDVLDEIALHPELEAQKRAARAEFARREWSWETCAARYLEILEHIEGRKPHEMRSHAR